MPQRFAISPVKRPTGRATVDDIRDDGFRALSFSDEPEPFAGLVDAAVGGRVHLIPVAFFEV